jgi:pimeloyl-ACP methyl ester carboxylesterase
MAERIVKANGIDVCCETFGDASAPPVLLIMGLGAQMIAFDEAFCAALAAKGFYVVRFDNRDIGRSTRFDKAGIPNVLAMMGNLALGRALDAPYALTDMAKDTVGLMDALSIGKAHVVGVSMGGMIGQTLAIHHGDRLRSLVSIMSSTGDRALPQATPEAAAVLITPAPLDRAGYIKHYANVLKVLRGPHFQEDAKEDEAKAARNFDRGINPAGVGRQLAAVLVSGNRTPALKGVTTPTLVIHGDADPLVRVEAGKATAAAIPYATLQIMPNMGHSLPQALWPRLIDSITAHARAH